MADEDFVLRLSLDACKGDAALRNPRWRPRWNGPHDIGILPPSLKAELAKLDEADEADEAEDADPLPFPENVMNDLVEAINAAIGYISRGPHNTIFITRYAIVPRLKVADDIVRCISLMSTRGVRDFTSLFDPEALAVIAPDVNDALVAWYVLNVVGPENAKRFAARALQFRYVFSAVEAFLLAIYKSDAGGIDFRTAVVELVQVDPRRYLVLLFENLPRSYCLLNLGVRFAAVNALAAVPARAADDLEAAAAAAVKDALCRVHRGMCCYEVVSTLRAILQSLVRIGIAWEAAAVKHIGELKKAEEMPTAYRIN